MEETKNEVKSGIGGKIRINQEFNNQLYVGLAEVKVIAINPSIEEYKEILGIELKEDSRATEYIGESKEGNTNVRIDVWVENVKTGKKDKITYFLEDKPKENKEGTKKQYINTLGNCSWSDDPNNLPDWFVKRDYRVANVGEEDFYNFLRSWLSKLDYKDAETTLQLEWKQLMKGNLKDIRSQINGEYSGTFVPVYEVKSVDKEGETKNYQSIYNKAFLASYALKQFRLVDYDKTEVIEALKKKANKDLKPHERFVLNVKGEYGSKNSHVLKDLKEFKPEDFIVTGDKVIQEDDASY